MSCLFFFFKQKTAYEMRISDWSSDVCSSDLHSPRTPPAPRGTPLVKDCDSGFAQPCHVAGQHVHLEIEARPRDRQSVVEGKSVSVSVDLGGGRINKKKRK